MISYYTSVFARGRSQVEETPDDIKISQDEVERDKTIKRVIDGRLRGNINPSDLKKKLRDKIATVSIQSGKVTNKWNTDLKGKQYDCYGG